MPGRKIQVSPTIRMELHNEEFQRVRKTGAMIGLFHLRGEEWVERLNAELHTAQAKRKQPVEDGYVYHVSDQGTRARLYIVAATARAQAHERAHSSILKLMQTTNYEVHSRAQLEKKAAKATAKAKRKEARRRAAEADQSPHERPPHNLDES